MTPPGTGRDRRTLGFAAVGVAVLCFSISSPIIKWADMPGAAIALWRMLFASALWWTVLVVHHLRTGFPLPSATTWKRVAPAGLFFGANLAMFFTVVGMTSIAHAEFISSMSPLLLVPAGALIFHEHPNWGALRWGLLSLVGIGIVLFAGDQGGEASVRGDLLMLVVLSLWVAYLLATKWARRHDVHLIHFMACAVPIGVLSTAPIAFWLAGDAVFAMNGRGWLVAGVLAVVTGVGAHGLIVFAQHHVPVATIGVLQVAQPGLAVFWAWVVLGETVRPAQLPGMALVVLGLAAFTMASQRRPVLPPVVAQPPSLTDDPGPRPATRAP